MEQKKKLKVKRCRYCGEKFETEYKLNLCDKCTSGLREVINEQRRN